jgi:hypothetical protein
MSNLKAHEKIVFEKLFDRGGYVLDFTDRTFAEFFREHGIDIDADKFRFNGTSKMKRLRAFWEIEPDSVVGHVSEALLEYACIVEPVDKTYQAKAMAIIDRLVGKSSVKPNEPKTEQDFLKQEFSKLDLTKLNIDEQLHSVIAQRIDEIQKSLNSGASLSVIFLCGSTLEGLLLNAASKNSMKFNQAKSAPKDKEEKVKLFHDWMLDSLINVAQEVGLLSLDIKKHSHSLKDFRNYIHPRQQAVQGFKPDQHTAKISWQVLQAAIASLGGQRNS